MSNRKISSIIAAVAGLFIIISTFSTSILTKSRGKRSFGVGYTEVEECRGPVCRSVGIEKIEKDLAPFAQAIRWLCFLIGLTGFAILARRFIADDTYEAQQAIDKYHLSYLISSIVGMLALVGFMMAMQNMHGLKRMKLEAGFGFYMGMFGYLTAIVSFVVMKTDKTKPGEKTPAVDAPPPPPPAN